MRTVRRLRTSPSFTEIDQWREARMPFLSGAEDRAAFFKRISRFLPTFDPRYQAIERAYGIAKDAFRDDQRSSGERYFEHLRAVALILLEYLEITDCELIVAALLHDIVEDKPEWPIERVREEFGSRVALWIQFLSQPQNGEFGSKEESEHVYHARFEFAPREVLIIKLADRLHNLLTLGPRPPDKRRAKIEETELHYMRYARRECILLPELREVLGLLRKALNT